MVGCVSHRHAAFSGRDRPVGGEREARHRCSAGTAFPPWVVPAPPPGRREGVRCVLHQPESVPGSESLERVDVHHQAADMGGDHSHHWRIRRELPKPLARSDRRKLSRRVVKIQVCRHRVTVYEDGNSALVTHDLGRCRKRHRWYQNPFPLPQAECFNRQMQGGGARVERDGVAGANGPCEPFLELSHSGSGGQPSGVESGYHFLDLEFRQVRATERNASGQNSLLLNCASALTNLRIVDRPALGMAMSTSWGLVMARTFGRSSRQPNTLSQCME